MTASVGTRPLRAGKHPNGFINNGSTSITGLTLLQTMQGFWNGKTYSGSGNWLNSGTAGATGDLVPGAATAAPTFSTDHFSFDGVNDFMACAGDVDLFDALNKNLDFTVGMILSTPVTPVAFGTYWFKETGAPVGWIMYSNNQTFAPSVGIADATHALTVDTATQGTAATKILYTGGVTAAGNIFGQTNNNAATTVADARTATSDNATALTLGKNPTATTFQVFDLYAAFIYRGALTAQNRTDIAAYYNLSI